MTQEEWNSKGVLGVETISMTPGAYDYEIQFRDTAARRLGVYKGTYENNNYFKPQLIVSDILLIGDIRPRSGGEHFHKSNIAFTPKMFSNYQRGEKIGIYFEIYNLTYGPSNNTDYKVEYKLQEPGGKSVLKKVFSIFGGKKETVSSEYRYSGSERDEQINLTFDLSNRPAGNYEIIIQVKDMNSGEEFERKIIIKVV